MLRLTTFGNLSVTRGEETLGPAASQRRRLALLALLAVAGDRGLPRDKILAFLWPESGEERARHSLTQSLYALRRDLREDELFLGTADLRLNPAVVASDVAEFTDAIERRQHARAVELYTGPFLDGCFLSDAPEFERWAEGERARLRRQVAGALESLATAATSAGDHRAAADWWRRLASLDPLDSRIAVGLMTALAAAGNTAGALQHARVHEALVRSELDAAPDAAVGRLVERLRREQGAPSAPAPPTPAPALVGSGGAGVLVSEGGVAPSSVPRAGATVAPGDARVRRSAPLRLLTTTTWHAVESAKAAQRSVTLRRAFVAAVVAGGVSFLVWLVSHLAAR